MYHLYVPDMHCGACLRAVTRALQGLDPQAQVEADLERRVITVTSIKENALLEAALDEAGYRAQPFPRQAV
ncbi:heavy-metal-associated domain-containing protein [Microvirga sp. CF3016]|uniref:heavy-metal-associated domain-containing protein n=1 Tax=Microvirga sp. CF3016 TaxID=3110181 RepID=UPI002E7858AC|nr:heavy-metal-associated domain-containing protein [Microvirga sp. CF3016]MEE1613521.1 heavy-metal-associated domain-containing protein [Microvirga sp. CF3016]